MSRLCAIVFVLAVTSGACDKDDAPMTPTSPTPAGPASVLVTVAGGEISDFLARSQTKQFVATAIAVDGAKEDATNRALWQSSDTGVATVSPAGLVTAVGFGSATIKATVSNVGGQLAMLVKDGCLVTVDPPSLVFVAAGYYSACVKVKVLPSSCLWQAESDAAWLPLKVSRSVSGGGVFFYSVSPQTSLAERTANIVVTASDGTQDLHRVTQQAAACSFVLTPEYGTLPRSGGTGEFTVRPTPADCAWTATLESDYFGSYVRIDRGTGRGTGTVAYTGFVNNRGYGTTGGIVVRGAPTDPPTRFTLTILY